MNSINVWGGSNTHLLKLPGKIVGESNYDIAISMAKRLEWVFRSFYWENSIGGISACQVAKNKDEVLSLFILKDKETLYTFTNPKVVDQSQLGIITIISCYSSPTGEFALQIAPQWMQVQYLDLKTKKTKEVRLNHPLTNPTLHEMTHLRGASFWDDVIPSTHVLTHKELSDLNAKTDEQKFKALLGNHALANTYKDGAVLYLPTLY